MKFVEWLLSAELGHCGDFTHVAAWRRGEDIHFASYNTPPAQDLCSANIYISWTDDRHWEENLVPYEGNVTYFTRLIPNDNLSDTLLCQTMYCNDEAMQWLKGLPIRPKYPINELMWISAQRCRFLTSDLTSLHKSPQNFFIAFPDFPFTSAHRERIAQWQDWETITVLIFCFWFLTIDIWQICLVASCKLQRTEERTHVRRRQSSFSSIIASEACGLAELGHVFANATGKKDTMFDKNTTTKLFSLDTIGVKVKWLLFERPRQSSFPTSSRAGKKVRVLVS